MIANHSLATTDLRELASGRGSARIVGQLATAQFSKRLLCLRLLMDTVRQMAPGEADRFHSAYNLLADVQARDPRAVAQVLMYPSVGMWSLHCLRALRCGNQRAEIAAELGYLGAIAAAAATRAEHGFEITVPMQSGSIMLPTLGLAQLGNEHDGGLVVLRGENGRIEVDTGRHVVNISPIIDEGTDGPGWSQLRRLIATTSGHTLGIFLDDLDPYRASLRLPLSSRLPAEEVEMWGRTLNRTWAMLVDRHSAYARAISVGMVSLVPLMSQQSGRGMSVTSSQTFGSCALSDPVDAITLAVTLIHEFQHAKLGCLHDLIPLHSARRDMLYYSPWREDPRPLHGLLHGVYAYLGVTDFWRTQRQFATANGLFQFEFARSREQTGEALTIVEQSGYLTEAGECFVAEMRAQLDHYQDDLVPEEPTRAAKTATIDHRISWRIRNLVPDRADVDKLAAAWLADVIAEPAQSQPAVGDSGWTPLDNPRLSLLCLRLMQSTHPYGEFKAETKDAGSVSADVALVDGELATAARAYSALIMIDPDRTDAWTGLALTQQYVTPSALRERPELVYAVHQRIRALSDTVPEPLRLASWLRDATNVRR